MLILAVSLGALIGIVLGLTGAGGGILAVPALTLVLGWSMTQAAPIALLAVGGAAAIGALQGFKKGLLRFRAAVLMAGSGMLVAPLGQYVAAHLAEPYLILLFATVMLIVAIRLWHSSGAQILSDDEILESSRPRKINLKTGRIDWNISSFLTLMAIGVLTGFTSGLLGVGGGFIIVPALLRCSNITLDGIVATSLMVIALVSGSAFLSAWLAGQVVFSSSAGLFIAGAAIGMLLARHYAARLPKHTVLRAFAVLVVLVSLALLYKLFARD
ncbi:MAG: sulfite exporter TauE/SafE family protein [Gallionella sp.]